MKELAVVAIILGIALLALKSCSDAEAACNAQPNKCSMNGNCQLCKP